MFNDNDPYEGVNFDSPIPSVNSDELAGMMVSLQPQKANPFGNMVNSEQSVSGGTDSGISRVNDNTPKTGVVGYKDNKGQAVLTNVAKNAITGKEESILSASNSDNLPNDGGAIKIDAPLVLTNILDKLSKTQDSSEARGIFASFQEASAREQIRLQSEALAAAQTKLGIPPLEQKLAQSEATDKTSIGWYPGIGDSPVTQRMRTELSTARGYADIEAKRNLDNNLSYKILGNNITSAQREMTRIQGIVDSRQKMTEAKSYSAAMHDLQKEEDDKRLAEGMTNATLSRIQLLNSTDFSDEVDPRVRAAKILKSNKNKDFQAAVTAEGHELTGMAIKGNNFAKKIVITEEASNTGMPTAQVEANINDIRNYLDNPPDKILKEQLNKIGQAAILDTSKKGEVQNQKIRVVLDYVAKRKTINFIGDVSSWNSIDPALQAAADSALKTTGKRSMENVLSAYIGDSTGPEYIQKISEFNRLAETAIKKQANSMFGMPDFAAARAIIADHSIEHGVFRKWLSAQMNKPLTIESGLTLGGPVGGIIGAWWEAGNALEEQFPITGPAKKPIDPATGKAFGE